MNVLELTTITQVCCTFLIFCFLFCFAHSLQWRSWDPPIVVVKLQMRSVVSLAGGDERQLQVLMVEGHNTLHHMLHMAATDLGWSFHLLLLLLFLIQQHSIIIIYQQDKWWQYIARQILNFTWLFGHSKVLLWFLPIHMIPIRCIHICIHPSSSSSWHVWLDLMQPTERVCWWWWWWWCFGHGGVDKVRCQGFWLFLWNFLACKDVCGILRNFLAC